MSTIDTMVTRWFDVMISMGNVDGARDGDDDDDDDDSDQDKGNGGEKHARTRRVSFCW